MKKSCFIIAILFLFGCSKNIIETKSGLRYQILQKGTGEKAKEGDEVLIYETTSYRNGTYYTQIMTPPRLLKF